MAHTSGQASHPEVFGQHKWHMWWGGKEGGKENEAFGDKGDGGGSRESWRR